MSVVTVAGVADSDGVINVVHEPGVYPASVQSAEWKTCGPDSKWKDAVMLSLGFAVNDPETNKSNMVFDTLFMPNEYMDAGQKQKAIDKIKCLQRACGLEDMGDAIDNEAFMYCNLQVELTKKDDKEYGLQNKVRDYLPE
jgi:hypothetical protein